VSEQVALHVWRVPATAVPRVFWRLARDRATLRRRPGVRFVKLLGTARRFGPGQADLTRWAALVVWTDADPFDDTHEARAWRALATASCRLDLRAVSSKGRWSGQEPFHPGPNHGDGLTLALTRARLRPTKALRFWRAVPAVGAAANRADGLITSFGVGEAPLGWQGTISLWRNTRDLVEFAYRHPYHRRAIEATHTERWYAEELFARFEVLSLTGDDAVLEASVLEA
jgi:hypothetical protein